jgi:hypothetical protein
LQWRTKKSPSGLFSFKIKENKMAVKSWYLSIVESTTHKPVFHQMFFTAPKMNEFIKEKELLEKYPKPEFYFVKENY